MFYPFLYDDLYNCNVLNLHRDKKNVEKNLNPKRIKRSCPGCLGICLCLWGYVCMYTSSLMINFKQL